MAEQRMAQAELTAWRGIAGHIGLVLLKLVTGVMTGSIALIADAAHTASSMISTISAWIGLRSAKRFEPEERSHTRRKAESITTIIATTLLVVVGIELTVSAVKSFIYGVNKAPGIFALVVIIVSIILKESFDRYMRKTGDGFNVISHAHAKSVSRLQYLSVALASMGIGGAWLGERLGITGLYYLDPACGLLIALLLIWTGFVLFKRAIYYPVNQVPRKENAVQLTEIAEQVPGVITVDDLRAWEHGFYVVVDLKISVNPGILMSEGHEIARAVRYQLMRRFVHIAEVFVQVSPYDPGYPYKNNVDSQQRDIPSIIH